MAETAQLGPKTSGLAGEVVTLLSEILEAGDEQYEALLGLARQAAQIEDKDAQERMFDAIEAAAAKTGDMNRRAGIGKEILVYMRAKRLDLADDAVMRWRSSQMAKTRKAERKAVTQ